MYQACAHWRALGCLGDIRVVLVVPEETVFGLAHIDAELERVIAEFGIEVRTASEVRAVRGAEREVAIGRIGETDAEQVRYDVLNVVPPQSAPGIRRIAQAGGGNDQVNPLLHVVTRDYFVVNNRGNSLDVLVPGRGC